MPQQATLPFGPFRNSAMFSSHWLESRLSLEPEWTEFRAEAEEVANRLGQLWTEQRERVDRYASEQALEQGFIQPVFDALGWKLNYETHLQGRRPDYALFIDDAALDSALAVDHRSHEFWQHAAIVADAKAWDISLDRPLSAQGQKEFPPQQIEWYLDRSRRDFGILTNGRMWRLIPRVREPHQGRFDTFYEIDVPDFLERWTTRLQDVEDFLYFYLLFSPVAFHEIDGPAAAHCAGRGGEYRVSSRIRGNRKLECLIEGDAAMWAYLDYVSSTESTCSLDAVHDAWVEMHPKYGPQLSAAALRKRAKYRKTDEARRSHRVFTAVHLFVQETYRQRYEPRRAHHRAGNSVSQELACPAWQEPELMAIENERDQIVAELVAELRPELARVVYLRYWHDMAVTEISKLVNRPSKTIYRWLDDAHKRLADAPLLCQGVE